MPEICALWRTSTVEFVNSTVEVRHNARKRYRHGHLWPLRAQKKPAFAFPPSLPFFPPVILTLCLSNVKTNQQESQPSLLFFCAFFLSSRSCKDSHLANLNLTAYGTPISQGRFGLYEQRRTGQFFVPDSKRHPTVQRKARRSFPVHLRNPKTRPRPLSPAHQKNFDPHCRHLAVRSNHPCRIWEDSSRAPWTQRSNGNIWSVNQVFFTHQ